MTDLKLEPTGGSARIAALDVLRGVAALGILLMNIPEMGLSWNWPKPPLPAVVNADWIAYTLQSVLTAGAMRGVFTLLFGASMLIMLKRSGPEREPAAVQAYFTRCFALLLLGVANFAMFLWPGEILFNYGLAGMIIFLFRKAQGRLLAAAAAAVLIVMTLGLLNTQASKIEALQEAETAIAAHLDHETVSAKQQKALATRNDIIQQITSPDVQAQESAQRTAYPSVMAWSMNAWQQFNVSAEGVWYVLESVGFMLIGMLLFKTGVLTGERPAAFYGRLALLGFSGGILLRSGIEILNWQAGFLPTSQNLHLGLITFETARLSMTLGFVGLTLFLLKRGLLSGLAQVLAAVGRMALTTYLGQSILTSILFYGFGLYGRFGFASLMGIAVLIWVVQVFFSVLWLERFEMGPAEWLLRGVTYGRFRPLRRADCVPNASVRQP